MRYLPLIFALMILSCNPVQRMLKEKEMIEDAINEYLIKNPRPTDTAFLPGKEIHVYDTAKQVTVVRDTVKDGNLVYITNTETKEIVKTVTKTDTIVKTVTDYSMMHDLRAERDKMEGQLMVMKKDKQSMFWIVAGISSAFGVLGTLLIKKAFR